MYVHTSFHSHISMGERWISFFVNSLVCIALLILALNILYFAIYTFYILYYFSLFSVLLELLWYLNFPGVRSIKFYLILSSGLSLSRLYQSPREEEKKKETPTIILFSFPSLLYILFWTENTKTNTNLLFFGYIEKQINKILTRYLVFRLLDWME